MSGLLLLNVLDVARALGLNPLKATPEQVRDWLIENYSRKRGGGFNYDPAAKCLFGLFNGSLSEESAKIHCLTTGNPKGRSQNFSAISQVAPYAVDNPSTCYRIGFAAVAVGRVGAHTAYVAIKAPLVRVVHSEIMVVMPGFRMSYRPAEPEIDVACSIVLANFARDDFADADFEYLYAGPGADDRRQFRAIRGRDRHVYDRDEVDTLLDVYVKGIALAAEAGMGLEKPNLKGYRIIDPYAEPPLPL